MDIAVRYTHSFSMFPFCGTILMESALLQKEMKRRETAGLAHIDLLLGENTRESPQADLPFSPRTRKGAE